MLFVCWPLSHATSMVPRQRRGETTEHQPSLSVYRDQGNVFRDTTNGLRDCNCYYGLVLSKSQSHPGRAAVAKPEILPPARGGCDTCRVTLEPKELPVSQIAKQSRTGRITTCGKHASPQLPRCRIGSSSDASILQAPHIACRQAMRSESDCIAELPHDDKKSFRDSRLRPPLSSPCSRFMRRKLFFGPPSFGAKIKNAIPLRSRGRFRDAAPSRVRSRTERNRVVHT